eukprot:scpid52835/ scgid19333/ 
MLCCHVCPKHRHNSVHCQYAVHHWSQVVLHNTSVTTVIAWTCRSCFMCWLITTLHNARLAAVSTSLTYHRECCTILTCKSAQLKMGSCHDDWGVQTRIIRYAVTRLTVCIEASCAVR